MVYLFLQQPFKIKRVSINYIELTKFLSSYIVICFMRTNSPDRSLFTINFDFYFHFIKITVRPRFTSRLGSGSFGHRGSSGRTGVYFSTYSASYSFPNNLHFMI